MTPNDKKQPKVQKFDKKQKRLFIDQFNNVLIELLIVH